MTGNPTSASDLNTLKNTVAEWKNIASQYGFSDVYLNGMDEQRADVMQSERPAWDAVHQAGGKVIVTTSDPNAVNVVGDMLDVVVFANYLNPTQAVKWNGYGHKIFSYANPQVGIENPEIYRTNYGFALWNAGYNGAMNYAYQHGFGSSIWNDYDSRLEAGGFHYKDHVFAYPTSNGVIDTIQWEGWREGVDDTRYVASLIKKEGSSVSAKTIVSAGLSNNQNMTTIRKKVIAQILLSSPVSPVANATVRNPVHTYPLLDIRTFLELWYHTSLQSMKRYCPALFG